MSTFNSPTAVQRAQDLVIGQNIGGLSQAEAEELHDLLQHVGETDVRDLDRAIDATRRAVLASSEPALPAGVRDRLLRAAPTMADRLGTSTVPAPRTPAQAPASFPLWRVLAVAACIGLVLLAAQLYVRRPINSAEPSIARIDSAADVVRLPFKAGEASLAGASGQVVWSDALQAGYMKIYGAKPNDPKALQYQLWIVDPKRDARPVDGGVFDLAAATASSGSYIVSFHSRLRVDAPAAFAITAEKPGGVVVSAGPLIMVAAR